MTEPGGDEGRAGSRRRPFDWESAGRELGASLGAYHALVVIGSDPVVTGRVAVGIARAQAMTRRVAVGDLFAESPPIQELVQSDDPHGLVDSFLYGVSLSRIAYHVPDAGEMFVMPSGTEPPEYEELFPNPRWHRLAAGFREVGALLVLAAPVSAPHIEDLVAATDGAVLVGEAVPRRLPVSSVVSTVREAATKAPEDLIVFPTSEEPAAARRRPSWLLAAVAGVLLFLIVATIAAWLAYRPMARGGQSALGPKPDTTRHAVPAVAPAAVANAAPRDSVVRPDSAVVTDTLGVLRVTNPQDSAQAAAFGVVLVADNTQEGAILKLQQDRTILPAATFAPILVQGTRWYKLIGGAYVNRAQADSLLVTLRQRNVLKAGEGTVVRAPYAFLIESGVKPDAVPGMLQGYQDHGIPVYALRQADGTAWLLAGAFESLDQSSLYAESLRAPGLEKPVLVYRKGRPF
jgi:hypothetical protein